MGKKKIMIIEDNQLNQELLIEMLKAKDEDFELLTVSDGEEGLKKAGEHQLDLILLDIQLPGMDGYHFFELLKERKTTSGIPVLAVTAYATQEDRDKIIKAGFDGYISKPIALNELFSALEKVL